MMQNGRACAMESRRVWLVVNRESQSNRVAAPWPQKGMVSRLRWLQDNLTVEVRARANAMCPDRLDHETHTSYPEYLTVYIRVRLACK